MAKREKRDTDSDSGSSSSGDEWGKKAKKKGKRVKSVKEEEEREEGEVDDDEDDDLDDDDDIDEFNDGFDENLMGDDEDQKRLAEMTEKEREQELFNRSEKREVLRTRFEIERKLRLQKRKENASSKDKPTKNEFTEASLRSDERRRNIESKKKQNSALQGLKEQREKKKQKAQILRAADVYSSSSSSDDDEDGGRKGSSSSSSSSSDESDDGKRHRRRSDDDELADNYEFTLADLNKIRVTRKEMEAWVHAPFFANTMVNSFVKMGIGMRQSKQVYRVCQVIDVVEGPIVYNLEKTKTDKLLKCRHSKDDRNFRIEYVSNGEFGESEFEEWKIRCTRDNVDFPTRGTVEGKKRDIENARNYRYSDHDIHLILKEKEKFNKTPKNYAMKKTELMKMKEEAEQNNDHERVHQLQQELDQLEERAKELDKQRTHSIAAISYLNERNRFNNIAGAEKAILESQDDNKSAEADDPFRRRKCAPQLVHKVQKAKNPDGTPIKVEIKQEPGTHVKTEPNGSSATVTGGNSNVKVEVKQEKKAPASPTRDDLFDAHDFDIQIDFDIGSSLPSVGNSSFAATHSSGPDVKPSTNRRSLNLEEYKRKKGLI